MPVGFSAATYVAVAAVAAAAVSAYGSYESGQAQQAAAKYQSQVEQNNAIIAQQNAQWAAQAGNAQAEQKQLETRAKVGGILASQAAAGIDVNSGSAVDVKSSASELGELDAINIRSNAARTAYGYNVQSSSDQNQSQLDTFEGNADAEAGDIKAGGSVLSAVGTGYTSYASAGGLK